MLDPSAATFPSASSDPDDLGSSWQQLAADVPLDSVIPAVLPGILEAGNPYYEWLFGDARIATRILDRWLRRSSSEVCVLRARLLTQRSAFVGGFIALDGAALKTARKADTRAMLTDVSMAERPVLLTRLTNASALFPPVADNECYLSKIWLQPALRGRSYGNQLLVRYIEEGKARGHRSFRLHVDSANSRAIRLYQRHGFAIEETGRTADGTLEYHAMAYRVGRP